MHFGLRKLFVLNARKVIAPALHQLKHDVALFYSLNLAFVPVRISRSKELGLGLVKQLTLEQLSDVIELSISCQGSLDALDSFQLRAVHPYIKLLNNVVLEIQRLNGVLAILVNFVLKHGGSPGHQVSVELLGVDEVALRSG